MVAAQRAKLSQLVANMLPYTALESYQRVFASRK